LNPLADEINTLADRLKAINVDRITNDSRQKLNQWRINCHKKIDEFYEEKCKELDRYVNESVNEQRKAVSNLRSKMSELIEKQETTKHDIDFLTSGIQTLDR
jgi:replication fork clamp-binding protein CrfC